MGNLIQFSIHFLDSLIFINWYTLFSNFRYEIKGVENLFYSTNHWITFNLCIHIHSIYAIFVFVVKELLCDK